MMRRFVCVTAAVLLAGCSEPAGPALPALGVSWMEWPAAVQAGQHAVLRITGTSMCQYTPVFRVALAAGNEVRVTATTVNHEGVFCALTRTGSGAGYDTVLTLPALDGPAGRTWSIRAPIASYTTPIFFYGEIAVTERIVGSIEVRAVPDTTTRLAGNVYLRGDSAAACWTARPFSAAPQPELAFTRPVPMTPNGYRLGYVSGILTNAAPPICGQSLAINATELLLNATP